MRRPLSKPAGARGIIAIKVGDAYKGHRAVHQKGRKFALQILIVGKVRPVAVPS